MTLTPHPCHTCGHVEQLVVWAKGTKAPIKRRHDRCIHPEGPHEMNEFCAWHTSKQESLHAPHR